MRRLLALTVQIVLAGIAQSVLAQGATSIPESTKQLIVTVPDSWNTHRASMWQFQRVKAGGTWTVVSTQPTSVLLGKNGSAWGWVCCLFRTDSRVFHRSRKKMAGLLQDVFELANSMATLPQFQMEPPCHSTKSPPGTAGSMTSPTLLITNMLKWIQPIHLHGMPNRG